MYAPVSSKPSTFNLFVFSPGVPVALCPGLSCPTSGPWHSVPWGGLQGALGVWGGSWGLSLKSTRMCLCPQTPLSPLASTGFELWTTGPDQALSQTLCTTWKSLPYEALPTR